MQTTPRNGSVSKRAVEAAAAIRMEVLHYEEEIWREYSLVDIDASFKDVVTVKRTMKRR